VADQTDYFVSPPSNLDSLVQTSLRIMLPIIKSELSLINSVLELRDFTSLPRTIASCARFAFRAGRTLRQLLRVGSDAYLQQQFNILPLLSDICGFRTALSRYERRLNSLVANQGKTRIRHWSIPVLEAPQSETSTQTYTGAAGYPFSWSCSYPVFIKSVADRYVYTEPSLFHAQIQYNYNYTGYQLEHARVLALLDAFGVNLNPAIIWNAIPWSFVVDWLIGVGRWLNDRALHNMEPVINIHQYLWSHKRSRVVVVQRVLSRPLWYATSHQEYASDLGVPLPVFNETSYRRQVGMPSASSLLASGLSSKEFSLGAALVLSRGRHHRRRR